MQYVIRPMSTERPDYRGYAGTLAAGRLRLGDEVVVLPSGRTTTVAGIDTFDGELEEALPGRRSRCGWPTRSTSAAATCWPPPRTRPTPVSSFDATVCWMADAPRDRRARLLLKHTTRTVKAVVTAVQDRLDVTTLAHEPVPSLELNDIGRVTVRTAQPLALDPYAVDRRTGAFILVDEATGATVGAGMVAGCSVASGTWCGTGTSSRSGQTDGPAARVARTGR